jgi:hypothetical protein
VIITQFLHALPKLTCVHLTDTCTRESLSAWAAHLRRAHPTFYFRAASRFLPQRENSVPLPAGKARKLESSNDSLGADAILALLGTWAVEKPEGETLTVAVTGVVNVSHPGTLQNVMV